MKEQKDNYNKVFDQVKNFKDVEKFSSIQSKKDEDAVETIILDLLNEGVIYEPEPGRYKEL